VSPSTPDIPCNHGNGEKLTNATAGWTWGPSASVQVIWRNREKIIKIRGRSVIFLVGR
jgi:hypothetical protein